MQEQQWNVLLEITSDMKVIEEAFAETAKQGKRPSPAYIRSILERCMRDGVRPGAWAGGKPAARASPGPPAAIEYERKTITIYNPVTGKNENAEQLVPKQKPNN
jgi:hypothetical protein